MEYNDSSNDEEEQFCFRNKNVAKHRKEAANEHRKNVEELLKNRKDKKLCSKTGSGTQMLNIAKEELSLKRKLVEKLDKSDEEFRASMEKVNKTMENIGNAIQQSVGILSQLVRPQQYYPNPSQQPYFAQYGSYSCNENVNVNMVNQREDASEAEQSFLNL